MPRANRHFLSGYVWHLTHRCHQKQFLLKFPRDRRRYLHWAFEAKKRFGLSVLNYMVTSNHVHLLVKDTGGDVIAESMQLIAGRTAQEYNQRKEPAWRVLGRPLSCHRRRSRRTPSALSALYRPEHGSRRGSQAPVRVGIRPAFPADKKGTTGDMGMIRQCGELYP